MNSFRIDKIPVCSHFSKPAYLDKRFVLAAPEMPFAKPLVDALREWGFKEVLSEGESLKTAPAVPAAANAASEETAASFSAAAPNTGKLAAAQKLYTSFERYVRTLFGRFSDRNHLDFSLLVGNFKIFLDAIRKDYKHILQVQPQTVVKDEDYLIFHTMNATITSVIIGESLKMSEQSIMELSIAALLHEIGMLRLPPESYLGKRPLTSEERKLIYIHPIIGHNFLKSFDFPVAISRAVLEHHERENGSGYPKQKTAENIHLYSKIVAVACSYSAISAKRPYKDAMDSHAGMMELLKNEGKQYNDKVVRTLVSTLSVFPIGMYVMLSDGKKGQVIDMNPKKPYYPVVRILGEQDPDGAAEIVKTSEDGVNIVRALSHKETES